MDVIEKSKLSIKIRVPFNEYRIIESEFNGVFIADENYKPSFIIGETEWLADSVDKDNNFIIFRCNSTFDDSMIDLLIDDFRKEFEFLLKIAIFSEIDSLF